VSAVRVVEDVLDARSVPYSPDAAVYVVDSGAPAAIVEALAEHLAHEARNAAVEDAEAEGVPIDLHRTP